MVFVKDNKGRVLIVGAGDVAFDGEGRVRDGDMLTVYDPATREMDFVHAKDVTLERTTSSEEYAKDYQRQLEELNSTVYAEMQSGGEEGQPSLTEPAEPTKPVGEKETTPVGEEPVATLADGTPVPMMKDSKGRETADYSQMTPEQGAEWMSSQFGENAEAAVDGQIKRAEKTLKGAEKIKVDYTGDLNDAKEAEAQKKIAIEAAKAELELYTNIKKAMTEKKVKAGMEKASSVGGVGEEGRVGVAREKFESGLRVVGNKRTRTLADGSKLRGHYEIVDADSLTPSHNANDGYKKSEGFPVNEEGMTINDRDYENDKQAQLVTDMIAMKYDGQAVDQVPVVTSDGIVVDGNGRTMAGQKAAKDGTDGAYLEALKENAENYGFTAEQIEQSGIKHPRLVLVSDEPMKYDTATFAKFNKNEKKAQGNTQQAVANSKKLSADEIGTIISEIEGSGSLDAFFNNPSAINSLLTRLVDKGVIGLNEVAGLREGEDKLSAAGKDFVKNLLLGSVFSENTIRMMGADAMLKTKALNGIRAVTDNMKLGDYALMKEIDQAVQLLYEARQGGSGVDAYLRTPAMFGENAADRFDPISQAIALALEGKAEDFRELMMAYNRNAAPYADASQTEMFGERPTKEDFVNEFLKLRNWKDYETRHSSKEGNGDAGSSEGTEPQARGGSEPTEGQREVNKAVKRIATEITKQTGIEVVTDEKEAEEVLRNADSGEGSDVKFHKVTDQAELDMLNNEDTFPMYSGMQIIDGKLYSPMAAIIDGKRTDSVEMGDWHRADERPDLVKDDGTFVLVKTDKKKGAGEGDVPAAYNPYMHTSTSMMNDQFTGAYARGNIRVVEWAIPKSELDSGYHAEKAKDSVGMVPWHSGSVNGLLPKERQRNVMLSRWRKAIRVVPDSEVAEKVAKQLEGTDLAIPWNTFTPNQIREFAKLGVPITIKETGSVGKETKDAFMKQKAELEKEFPQAKFVDVKMTKDAYLKWGKNEEIKASIKEQKKAERKVKKAVKEFRTKDGEVYGFTDGEKIYLDTKKMKPETPLHEYAHLWCDMLRKVNPKEWENVKKLFDKVDGLKDEVQKLYPELEGDALYEEMITTYSGREGTKKLEDVVRKLAAEEGKSVTESAKAKGFLEKVKEALTKYWKGVADVLGIHFTTAEEVADKVLADWAKGVDPRESEEANGEGGNKPSEASLGLPKPLGENGASAQEGVEPSKTNPLAWLAHTAEMFKDEQVQKAKDGLVKAKESGDAEDIKRATADMKQAMETKLRGNGIGLVERRRIIGREIGKILGEEAGKAEAEKIDKPWEQMDLEEREAVSSKNPLTETEINELTSEENRELIPSALAYLRGDKGNIINAISYFKIWNDVRSRHENVPDNSGAKDGTQLDAPDTGGSQELGLERGRESGRPDEPVDRGAGNEAAPGERNSREGNQNDTTLSAGEQGNKQGEGNTSRMGTVPAGGSDTRGGGRAGNEGNVPKRGGQGVGNRPLDPNAGRKPAAKQGTHFPDSTSERLKQERAEYEQKKKDFWERWKKAGQGYMKISLTPFKALNLSPEQIEMLPELFKMHLNGAVLKIKEGIYKFNEWKAAMRAEEGEELKMIGLSDDDIDRFIEDYWNTPYQMDGETHTIGEWAGIHGNEKLRNKLSEPLNDKYQRQVAAEPIKVKIGDKKNIEETLPYLLPQQQEDVLRAETQFFGNDHADREHAYGKGYMFTNGTGTGKTFTGLGVAKRLVKQGKGRILIVTPSQKKVSDWIKDGRNLNMEIRDLDSIAKERGTTATTESGEGVVITTFANFGVNKKLLETKWDAVIYDESHRIMENKNGTETARSMQHYMVTNRSENHCFLRLQETNKDYQKMKSLGERFDAERGKEVKRIQDEYKASHPSATPRDVAYATSRMLPKERNGFTPGDYAIFPKLGKIHAEFVKALSHYTNEVEPKLKAQAKNEWKDTKTIFLSATPFNTRENLDYAEGYIFKYPEVEKGGRISGRTQFYLDHFGAAYKFRYNRLEQSTSNPEAVAKQEIEFSDYLQDTLGTMSGRIIDSPYDYSRDFPTVSPDHAEEFNQAVQDAVRGHGVLADAYRRTIGDYNYGSALFETMKVANIIERIKAHLDAGRKVVIFHRRVETKEPLKPPFAYLLEQANRSIALMKPGEEQKKAIQAVKDFRKKYADLLEWEQTLDYSMPREQIAKVFGKDKVLFFSGKESTKVKDKAVDTFNSDDSGKNIIVIQEASGKEGISLHDTTGKHQRVCITLALPQSPITALQIEGRTYRIGNKSNAIFEYPILGLNSEMMLFGQKFNNQVSTTENLALGSQARSLRDSFANGILEHSGVVPIDQQGVGGKEFDAPKDQSTDGFDNAVLDYYSNQKLNSRNREGVDYFPTPEPLGYKMMEWANMGEGDTVLEPSAGHGAIARYAPKGNQMVAIEPSQSLFTKLQLKAGGLGRKFQNTIFENYDISNKHDVVVMNPPFGTAGATAIAHLGKAFKHLEEGGRVVALIPRGSTDKKFDKWIEGEKTAVMRAEVELPDIVFEQAGTKVVCRVVVVDKISNEAMRAKAGSVEKWDLGGHYDKIEDFFEDLRDVEMPDRIIDTKAIMMKKSKQTVKDLKELKDARVDFNEGGINVRVRGDWKDYSIPFDMEGYNAEQKKKFLASMYETFEQQERQTRNETSQAVLAELKKLTCKLADMTEEEMQRYLKKKYEGKGVMYRIEHAAEVYNKAKQHYRMELGNTFSDSKEHFDAVRDRAVEEKGIVMPNLNKEKVKVVEVEKHGFGENKADAIKNARIWAKDNLATKNGDMPTMRDGTPYIISKAAIDKYLSNSAISKSEDPFVHLSVLPKLTDVIHESIEAEIHPDYKKGEDGLRSVENGYGEGVLVHRLYGAVEIDGKTYRVKTTMQEFRGGEENKPHSYEVTKIELLDSPGKRENPDRPPLVSSNNSIDNKIELPDTPGTAVLPDSSPLDMTPSNSKNITSEGSEKANESDSLPLNSATNGYISTAKLLQGVEKSYDSGKKLLDESKDLTDGETFFRKESDKSGYASLGLSKPTEPERKPDGRIVPADVDKKVVSEIEEKFEKKLSELVNLAKTEEDKAKIREHVRNEIIEFSRLTKTEIENERKNIQRDLGNVLDDRAKIRSEKILSATGAAFAADRELEYRRVRAGRLRESFGLQAGTETRADEIERLYKEVLARETGLPREDREKLEALAGRCSNLSMRLGVAFKNIDVPKERGLFGMSSSGRTIDYYIDTMVRTSTNTQRELATTLLHEMIHQATAGTLYLAEKGLGKEWLTEKQRKATDTIFEIYNKVSKDPKRFAESPYGLEDAYELTAQMADPLQRKAMDKFETIVAALRKRGDSDSRNLWQRFKDAIKALFEISDKDKMDKAINYILDDFNQSIDDAAMRMWEEEISPEGDKPRYASLSLTEPLEGRIAETVEKVSKQTGGKVKMVNSVEEIGNEQVRRDIENGKQVTGWYDEAIVQSYI
ncbi:DEAD/DEAH box helicase family protein [uncultured Prevotella sp.]|uniref:DEAD/DEAH box helicase family protein n=1 Tax=uncultured Prevotella sp. TaxID=159272 RepID=UPI0025FD60CF|nr:DEAD/DEAH box helicase family protein [uncultured Prevotella sp.]